MARQISIAPFLSLFQVAVSAVNALHGRWFAGKVITAAYVPVSNYVNLFPDSASSLDLLTTNR